MKDSMQFMCDLQAVIDNFYIEMFDAKVLCVKKVIHCSLHGRFIFFLMCIDIPIHQKC